MPLSPAELAAHPEFPHTIWPLTPSSSGLIPVGASRGGPVHIAYEIHGHGPRRIVWIMGLGGMKYAWQRQTYDFGHAQADKYSSLVFDNRGIGDSDKPGGRYSTSQMAQDCVELLDELGWTEERGLHVVGISMGGMIAQELALQIPNRICTLSLVSTAPSIFRTTGFVQNLWNRANLLIPKSLESQLASVQQNLYTPAWLAAPDATEPVVEPFPTNGDRFAANELWKRSNPLLFPKAGFLRQMVAAGWHAKTPAQLADLADKVGKRRIMVVHGTADQMLTFPHGVVLWRGLEKGQGRTGWENWLGIEDETDVWEEGEVEKHFVKGQGHVLPAEMRGGFRTWVEGLVERGEQLNRERVVGAET